MNKLLYDNGLRHERVKFQRKAKLVERFSDLVDAKHTFLYLVAYIKISGSCNASS